MPPLHILLIRHAETTSNIRSLYAGTLDCPLTNHGVEQTGRLASHLASPSTGIRVRKIFSSPQQRAFRTAEAVRKAQPLDETGPGEVERVAELREKGFGGLEGKSYLAKGRDGAGGGSGEPGEPRAEVEARAEAFVEAWLVPYILAWDSAEEGVVVVVSHGILLGHLWRKILARLPKGSVKIADEVVAQRDGVVLEHLGGWSNTGYLELVLEKHEGNAHLKPSSSTSDGADTAVGQSSHSIASSLQQVCHGSPADVDGPLASESTATLRQNQEMNETSTDEPVKPPNEMPNKSKSTTSDILTGYSTTILAIDSKQHLTSLKRQRGGIGRLAHDEGQKRLDSFFKKQRID